MLIAFFLYKKLHNLRILILIKGELYHIYLFK